MTDSRSSSGSIWPLIEAYVDACGHRAMDSTRIPEMESARRRLEEALGAAQAGISPELAATLNDTLAYAQGIRANVIEECIRTLDKLRPSNPRDDWTAIAHERNGFITNAVEALRGLAVPSTDRGLVDQGRPACGQRDEWGQSVTSTDRGSGT